MRRVLHGLGSTITIELTDPLPGVHGALDDVQAFLVKLESACTRFDLSSPLMRANAAPQEWHDVPDLLIRILREAHAAYVATAGRFDPRVHDALVAFGYGPAGAGVSEVADLVSSPWEPAWRAGSACFGGRALDFGGIGKGYAVREIVQRLREEAAAVLVEAGGDIGCAGVGPRDGAWHIGIEDPFGASTPAAVVRIDGGGIATSSTRVHSWVGPAGTAHHLIDPRTGAPGAGGLVAVTVIDADPMWAEIHAKSLFFAGAIEIAQEAAALGRPAAWITESAHYLSSPKMQHHEIWRASDAA